MHNAALRCLKRLHGAKQILSHKTDTRSRGINLLIMRGRFHIAMLDEEKICEMETAHSDLNSLSWLHTTSPTFPINGSNVNRACDIIFNISYQNLINFFRRLR